MAERPDIPKKIDITVSPETGHVEIHTHTDVEGETPPIRWIPMPTGGMLVVPNELRIVHWWSWWERWLERRRDRVLAAVLLRPENPASSPQPR
jgi:hypothetical protein